MRIIVGFITGVLVTTVVHAWIAYTYPSEHELAILVHIENDTELEVEQVTLESDEGQLFSCTLRFDTCSLGVYMGDTTFTVRAISKSGVVYSGTIDYSEPRTTKVLKIGDLSLENAGVDMQNSPD
jgi:hypothetical protein